MMFCWRRLAAVDETLRPLSHQLLCVLGKENKPINCVIMNLILSSSDNVGLV
jgi:hypothetical protein